MAKVLALSFGRKMSNTDVMLKHVLLKCQEAGHEIKFLRPDDYNIHPCIGCCGCVVGIMSGRTNGECVFKDDFPIIEDAYYEADAIIIGSPVYETSPSGTFKTFCDRMGPSHDVTFHICAKQERQERGIELMPDERIFKPRIGAIVGVGGAMTENWTIMTTPIMYEGFMSMGVDVIDSHIYYGAMEYEHVLGNPPQMERMDKMAQNIIDALAAETPEEMKAWRGNQDYACPSCHQSMFRVYPGTDHVECAICGIHGKVEMVDGKTSYTFSDAELERSRMALGGKFEHRNEIANGAMTQKKVENLKDLKAPYMHVGE